MNQPKGMSVLFLQMLLFGSLLYGGLRIFFNLAAWFLCIKHSIMSDTLGTIPMLRQHRFDFFLPTRT